ncbi:uncharacterized protein VNE69_03210 [Vairimorpha necatrix]|uniref:Uncharacterized protein n=2 Tax=Vairimorpha necatrix TaxID=6039 RepID=A0AAX4JAK4_9MICR
MNKSEKYKNILKIIKSTNLSLPDIIYKNIDDKHIYLELLMTPDLLPYLISTSELHFSDYFYLLYKFTSKFKITDNLLKIKCLNFFKYKKLRGIILKILKFYKVKNFQNDDIYNKINTNEFKYVKKFINVHDWESFPIKYTKQGYRNLKILRNNEKIEVEENSLRTLFLFGKCKDDFYKHEDEEVRIENFLNHFRQRKKNLQDQQIQIISQQDQHNDKKESNIIFLQNFIKDNIYIENIRNIDYLIENIQKIDSNDAIENETILDPDFLVFLINHEDVNTRYLGYSLFNEEYHNHDLLNNLIFDKSKIIRDKFIKKFKIDIPNKTNNELYYKTNIELYYKNIELYYRNNELYYKNIELYYKNIELYYKNIDKLSDLLIEETNLKYILKLEKCLNVLFKHADTFNYSDLISRIFKKSPSLNIRKSGGLSVICKCLLKNKMNRLRNLKLISEYLEIKKHGFMKNEHSFNIFLEIFKKYKILDDSEAMKIVLENVDSEKFIVKNMCIRMYEIIFKRGEVINIENKEYKDDSMFLFLCIVEKYKEHDLRQIKCEGNNQLIKAKLNELRNIKY